MPKKFQVVTRSAPMRAAPDPYAEMTSELLFGETVETISHHGNFLKCKNLGDDYEGFVEKSGLSEELLAPTHKIIRLHSFFYGEPDFKTPPATYLPFLSTFSLTGETENGFSEIEGGGWIWSDDIAPIEHHAPNMAATAQIFLNLPYLWGGKTSRGVDCSGLVQLALHHAGYACPRDSSDQEKAIKGENIDFVDAYAPQNLQKNDIVFLKGHVGIMLDETRFINATSRSMSVSIEDIKEITAHYEGGIRKVVRL